MAVHPHPNQDSCASLLRTPRESSSTQGGRTNRAAERPARSKCTPFTVGRLSQALLRCERPNGTSCAPLRTPSRESRIPDADCSDSHDASARISAQRSRCKADLSFRQTTRLITAPSVTAACSPEGPFCLGILPLVDEASPDRELLNACAQAMRMTFLHCLSEWRKPERSNE